MKFCYYFLIGLIPFALSCINEKEKVRTTMDLGGTWQFSIDKANEGLREKWFAHDLTDTILLPGTTDINQKGFLNRDTTTMHLNRLYKYEGAAWYRKVVVIPEEFRNKRIVLYLERTKSSTVWIDSIMVGQSGILQTPQTFDVTSRLTPGKHAITIRIDNSLRLTPYGNVHIYSDDTQTNWNGIIGDIRLQTTPMTYIRNIRVTPDVKNKKIGIRLEVENGLHLKQVDVALSVRQEADGKSKKLKTHKIQMPCDSVIILEYELGKDIKLWDDYNQPLYSLLVTISNGTFKDALSASFGMREFTVKGTRFLINERPAFLRGKHDACVFPLTGHPPVDVAGWEKIFKIAKSYGINHYRFHSYCPPDAAFTAADRLGIFLQAELPFWGGMESDSVAEMQFKEGIAMLENYANHPSFVLFSMGNEIWSGHERVEKNIARLKDFDDRPLYAMGSNNNIGYVGPSSVSDFFVAARTPYAKDSVLTHTRLTHAFADSREGGMLNTFYPSTTVKYDYPVSQIKIPIISHEIGQYQIFPDYNEIEKYTGVLKPWNLEVFFKRLQKAGMADQNKNFQKASGAWAALCYKAEMEAALRTKGMAGFQLLDLQDFPGQGTALVGILDAFMDDKGVISHEDWLNSCNDVVLLPEFSKYCWKNNETFVAELQVANYSNQSIADDINWEIIHSDGKVLANGTITRYIIKQGDVNHVGQIRYSLAGIQKASLLKLRVWLKETGYSNHYPLWVYPEQVVNDAVGVAVTRILNNDILSRLKKGEKVLYIPSSDAIIKNSPGGLFPPEFWNYGMFKGISEWVKKPVSPGTLGILTNPEHPIFAEFPTDFHTNWQWFSVIKASRPLILDKTDSQYRPVVQVIDNLERNHKLGLIFEFKMGKGKLLVCMSALPDLKDMPEAVQLYNSILAYMESDAFNPDYEPSEALLKELFK